ncbi:MAG TPA: sugar ABC transporter substrate-binding protein, partial [Microbacterium sp.]|uniref:sugar ABC transporter substrate-binding protein n=1 Tax=Microbacterium sp. TaxID=51671 RepID=UPI002B6B0CDC
SDEGSFWSVVKKGAEQASKDEGVKLVWSPSNNDPQKEAQLIDAAVSQKVDGLAVSVPNADAIKGSLAKAKAAGIPIITLNSGADQFQELGAITHVGQTEEIAGEAAGKKLKDAGVKKVLCVIHEQNNIGLQQRCDGVKKGFGGPVTNQQVKGTEDIATTQTEIKSKLQADKSFDGVIALNPDIASAAVTAVKGASSSAKIATFDLTPNVIKDIKAGTVLFAVDQQQYLQGYLPIVFLKLFKVNANTVGGGLPVLTGPGFVDKSNAATVEKLAAAGTR